MFCFVAVVCKHLRTHPQNVAALAGQNVTLRCAGPTVTWMEYVSLASDHPETISSETEKYHPDKYHVETKPTGTYDLTIISIQLNQAGRYTCKSLEAPDSHTSVYVIVFSGKTL